MNSAWDPLKKQKRSSHQKKKKVADIQTDTRGGNCVQCFGVNENEQHK